MYAFDWTSPTADIYKSDVRKFSNGTVRIVGWVAAAIHDMRQTEDLRRRQGFVWGGAQN